MTIYHEEFPVERPLGTLVFLHGWGSSSDIWHDFIAQFKERYHCILIDLPGMGRSIGEPAAETSADMADQIAHLVPLGSVVVGWSLGGQVAVAMAERMQTLSAVITIATGPCFVEKTDWSAGMMPDVFNGFVLALQQQREKTLQRFMLLQAKGGEAAKEVVAQLRKASHYSEQQRLSEALELLREDCRASFDALSLPVLHIFGEKDALVDVQVAEQIVNANRACKVIAQAAHLPFISHSGDVSSAVLGFLDSLQVEA
ncbi:MAG: alpha/beta fold hydrolase [Pseudomonadales bacterium]